MPPSEAAAKPPLGGEHHDREAGSERDEKPVAGWSRNATDGPYVTLSPTTALVAAGAVVLGGVVKGALGMGFPIVATPLLTLVLGPEIAVVGIVVPSLMMNVVQAWQGRRFLVAADPVVRLLVPTLVTIVVGTVVGAYLLVTLPTRGIALVVGVSVMLYAIVSLRGVAVTVPPRHLRATGILVGFAGGVLGGATGFFGLPLILLFSSLTLDKAKLPALVSIVLLCGVAPQIASYVALGLLTGELLALSTLALVPATVGFVLGTALRRRMSQAVFALAIRLALLTIGAGLAGRAAGPHVSRILAWLTAAG
jgi:uncharacterized membrane protein YfcA